MKHAHPENSDFDTFLTYEQTVIVAGDPVAFVWGGADIVPFRAQTRAYWDAVRMHAYPPGEIEARGLHPDAVWEERQDRNQRLAAAPNASTFFYVGVDTFERTAALFGQHAAPLAEQFEALAGLAVHERSTVRVVGRMAAKGSFYAYAYGGELGGVLAEDPIGGAYLIEGVEKLARYERHIAWLAEVALSEVESLRLLQSAANFTHQGHWDVFRSIMIGTTVA